MPDLLADGSLPARWARRWAERPSWPQLRDVDDRWLTSDQLEEMTRHVAGRLRGAGVAPGERFVTCAPSSAALVVAYIGALRAGLVVVPLNTGYTRAEVTRIVTDARPALAAVADDERAGWLRELGVRVCGIDVELPGGEDEGALDAASADDAALLIYTSGTTGRPKGARLSHGNLLASATAVAAAWEWTPEDRLLLTLPLFHVHGLGVGLNGALCAGSSLELRPRFDQDDVLARAAGVSMFFGVPTMYGRLAASDRCRELAPLRLLVSGSAPLPPSVAEAIAAATGQLPLERYGMTETIMLTTNPLHGERRPGTVGFPFPGVQLRLAADDEIQVCGPNVIDGYWEQPDATAEAFTADGWFRTGDLGAFDADGYLRIIGRSKELIISGGFNVYPREVEEQLLTHPDVREVAVVGRPSEQWGEEVTAVVVAERPVEPAVLHAHAAAGLVAYKVPKRFEFVDELPRNALGKVVRSRLTG
ncbi:MAG TPA: AMP-binding protein [Solirubrobacteraceae bacterium]|nr:AMP-binding protein [Solirubrobacteraceae bacterium]